MPIILTTRYFPRLWQTDPSDPAPPPVSERTQDSLRVMQARFVARNPAKSDPYEVYEPIPAYIDAGVWRVRCECGEAPHTDPEWRLACCFGCGAIYTNVVFPNNYKAIEDLLVKRRVQLHRNWRQPETLDDLIKEQIAHGEPV